MDVQGWGGGLALRPRDYLGAGEPLADVVRAAGPFRGEALCRLALGTAATLARLHVTGIAGLRLSPLNVLIGPLGEAAFAPGARSSEFPASDVREWAEVIVFAATGQAGDPDLDRLPPALRGVIDQCRRPDPGARPTAVDLVRLLLGHTAPARHSSVRELLREAERRAGPYVPAPPEPRRSGTALGYAVLFGVMAAVVVVSLLLALTDRPSTGPAVPEGGRVTGQA